MTKLLTNAQKENTIYMHPCFILHYILCFTGLYKRSVCNAAANYQA